MVGYLKILITHELFPPDVAGGGERLTLKLAQGLRKKGHSIKILTSGNPRIKEYDDFETIRIPFNRYLMNLTVPMIVRYAKDVDIIQTSSGNTCFPSWIASKLIDKPICCFVHHILGPYWRDVRGEHTGKLFQFLEKIFLTRDYDAIVFQNKKSRQLGLNLGVDEKRIHMVQPGIDYKRFQMKNVKKEPFVLFVGNFSMDYSMVKYKGLDYLIEAAKSLPDVKFLIVGEGEYLEVLRKESSKNVVFVGGLTRKPLIELYNKALIFCLPSLTEGFGLVLLEAMASGCAVVSTIDVGQKGMKIRVKNVEDIVESIKYLIDNPELALRMGRENRELAKEFTWKKFIDGFIKIYELIRK